MKPLPTLDLHAHIDPSIAASELTKLNSVVFAATRSLEEAASALGRSDSSTVWGVGCHPGLVRAQKTFDASRFGELITATAYVSEVGLDGHSRVPTPIQHNTFTQVLRTLQDRPRITSIHSDAATDAVLDLLSAHPIHGAVLHWWLGDKEQTQRAVDMGCYFSINPRMLARRDVLAVLPASRVLTETDHPFGDRGQPQRARPGGVEPLESALACQYGVRPEEMRQLIWRNLSVLVNQTRCAAVLPRTVRVRLAALT